MRLDDLPILPEFEEINEALDDSDMLRSLERVRELLARIPPGPWTYNQDAASRIFVKDGNNDTIFNHTAYATSQKNVVEFICASRWLIEVLLDLADQSLLKNPDKKELLAAYLLGFAHGEKHSATNAF